MTDTAGPFDGTPWAEAQWTRHAASWAPSAVYGVPAASTSTGDLPLSTSGLSVGLGAGRAYVRGSGFERTGAAVMQAVTANTHASFSRRDRIVLRRDLAAHTVTAVLLTGTPASSPAAPALTQSDSGSWDLPLFSFLVPPASGTTLSGIVDERGWISDGSSEVAFQTTSARDANLPAPGAGRSCTVAGKPYRYDGSAWRPLPRAVVGGTLSIGLSPGGQYILPHGLGAAPSVVHLDLIGSGGAAQFGHVYQYGQADATNILVQVADTRDGSPMANFGVTLSWEASLL